MRINMLIMAKKLTLNTLCAISVLCCSIGANASDAAAQNKLKSIEL